MKLKVFVDDITALVKRKNKEVAEMSKKVMKKLKEEVPKKGLKWSVTENGKEGKSKTTASCGFLENERSQFSKEEGMTLADSAETLGVDLRTRVKRFGAEEKARREKCKVRFSIFNKDKAFQKSYMGQKVAMSGYDASKSMGSACSRKGLNTAQNGTKSDERFLK